MIQTHAHRTRLLEVISQGQKVIGATYTHKQTLFEASHCFPWQPRDVLVVGVMERIVPTQIAPHIHLFHSHTPTRIGEKMTRKDKS